MKNIKRLSLNTEVAVALLLISMTIVAATIYHYYTATVTVQPEAPKINWVTGSDVSATISDNKSYCELTIDKLQPNATTVYTSALKFTVVTAATTNMKLQIASVTDDDSIIWGIRFYIYMSDSTAKDLTLVDGGHITVSDTDGSDPVAEVGFYQTGASTSYGTLIGNLPGDSGTFTGSTGTYIIVVEAYGIETCEIGQSATIELRLIWN